MPVSKKRLERQFGQLRALPRLPPIQKDLIEAELQVDAKMYLQKMPVQRRLRVLEGLALYGGLKITIVKIPNLAEGVRMRVGNDPFFRYQCLEDIAEYVEQKVYERARYIELGYNPDLPSQQK